LLEEVHFDSWSWSSTALDAVLPGLRRNCPLIYKLSLGSCEVSDACLRDIVGMEALKNLTLDRCRGLTDARMTALATSRLTTLFVEGEFQTVAFLQSFVGPEISHTLESLHLPAYISSIPMDDVRVAKALQPWRRVTA
jgi:hypothetical protein